MRKTPLNTTQASGTRRLLLIQPRFGNKKLDRNRGTLPPLGLAYVAACTPDSWDVKIVDEHMEDLRFEPADLVGISTTTCTINRGYEIAGRYRSMGAQVVFGGVHASLLPEEALRFGDCVVIGDAEPVWPDVIRDFESGKLNKTYKSHPFDLTGLCRPRTDLFTNRYMFYPVSASRGCPFHCEFCAINRFYEGKYRIRPAREVLEDLKQVPGKLVFFTDGNLYGYHKTARDNFMEICRLIIRERESGALRFKHWMAYSSVNGLQDEEALALAAESGCRALFVGFESIQEEALKEMGKVINLQYGAASYPSLIRNAHRQGILVIGEIIMGFDSDTLQGLEATRRFIEESEMDLLRLQILQPIPGTRLYEKLEREGRLLISHFPEDWNLFTENFVMGVHYRLKSMKSVELQKVVKETGTAFYSPRNVLRRMWRVFSLTRDPSLVLVTALNSYNSRKTYVNFRLPGGWE
jgi:radical SAM superfamily enzyme YgiQ (UPF0313 family)